MDIHDLDDIIERLPCLNSVLTELLALDPDCITYTSHLVSLAEHDPTFTSRILQTANASDHPSVSPIKSIRQALARIGLKTLSAMISTYALMDTFKCESKGELELWIHSVLVAVIAKVLAEDVTSFELTRDEAYLCGLLHDIGRFIVEATTDIKLNLYDELNWSHPIKLIKSEVNKMGLDHATIGGLACSKWKLPDYITIVVTGHHLSNYSDHNQENKKMASLVKLIQLADHISLLLISQPSLLDADQETLTAILEENFETCAFWQDAPVKIKKIIQHLPEFVDEARDILSYAQETEQAIKTDFANLFYREDSETTVGNNVVNA
jgi:HD-like signal output (HDOD) protein